jgi:hypothetical protein
MIDTLEWLKSSKWFISTLWKNSKSLAQGGHAQAHAYICSSITCAQLVDIIGSPRIIEDQLPAYLGGSISSELIRVYLLSWVEVCRTIKRDESLVGQQTSKSAQVKPRETNPRDQNLS